MPCDQSDVEQPLRSFLAAVAVQEILLQSWAVASMIRDNKVHQIESLLQSANHATTGMYFLDNCIVDYVRDGLITVEEGARVAHYPDQVRKLCSEAWQE